MYTLCGETSRILHCVKENLCGALVRKSIGMYLSDFLRLFTIHTISELSTSNRSQVLCYKIVILLICYLKQKYTPKLRKSKIAIFYSWLTKGLFTWRRGTPGKWGDPPSRGRKIKCLYVQSYNPGMLGWGFLRLLLRLQLRSLSIGILSSHLEKDERLILGHTYLFMKASRVVLRGVRLHEGPLT